MTDELRARIDKTMENLRRNKMEPYFCETSADARELVKTLINKGDTISSGGSVTLKQTGVYDIITSNKLVKNINKAAYRVKTKAAPPNTVRLNKGTYCAKAGQCVSLNKEAPEICDGCHSDGRICCNFVVCAQQRHVNRIKVIIVNEELGY